MGLLTHSGKSVNVGKWLVVNCYPRYKNPSLVTVKKIFVTYKKLGSV